jgi:hypothetical protein
MRFFDSCFFIKRLVLVSIDMPNSDFEMFFKFSWLFVLKLSKNLLPAVNEMGESKIEP